MLKGDKKKENRTLFSIFLYRFSQFVGFLFSISILTTIVFAFALYVSTFFLFNKVDNLQSFIFDFKVHLIIFSAL